MLFEKILLRIFGTGFLIASIALGYVFFSSYSHWSKTQKWEKSQAHIESVDLSEKFYTGKTQRGNSDPTTYLIKVQYRYEFQGKTYQGNQISPYYKLNTSDKYRYGLYKKIRNAKSHGEKMTCYVDPTNPTNCYLDRKIETGSIYFFAGGSALALVIGSAAIVFSFLLKKRSQKIPRAVWNRLNDPDESDSDWI